MKEWMKYVIIGVCFFTGIGLGLSGMAVVAMGDKAQSEENKVEPVKVALLGDSITAGYGGNPYDETMQEKLGVGYKVLNFGESGASASSWGALPYTDTPSYDALREEHADIIMIQLGTNDTACWLDDSSFKQSYTKLMQNCKDTGARVILVTPPKAYDVSGDYGVVGERLELIAYTIQKLAEDNGMTVVDLYSASDDSWLASDGVHLNSYGAQRVGELMAEGVTK